MSDAVVWTAWNLYRMFARYSYLKLKIVYNFFSKKFLKIFFQKRFFKKLFPRTFGPKFFLKNIFYPEIFLILLYKNRLWPKFFFVVAEINLKFGVHCILVHCILVLFLLTWAQGRWGQNNLTGTLYRNVMQISIQVYCTLSFIASIHIIKRVLCTHEFYSWGRHEFYSWGRHFVCLSVGSEWKGIRSETNWYAQETYVVKGLLCT